MIGPNIFGFYLQSLWLFCKGSIYFLLDILGIQVSKSDLCEVEAILTNLEAVNRALLHPVVIIWVSLYI